MHSLNCSIRNFGFGILVLSSLAAHAQWASSNRVYTDANPQLNNWGQQIKINNPTPQLNYGANYGGTFRTGVYHGSNRWSSNTQFYPMGRGNVYVNGFGAIPSSNLFTSRYSYELQAPLFKSSTTGQYMVHNDNVSAPVYSKNPVSGVPGYDSAAQPARVNSNSLSSAAFDSRLPSSNLSNGGLSNSSLPAGTVLDSTLSAHVDVPASAPAAKAEASELHCGSGAANDLVADMPRITTLTNLEATVMSNYGIMAHIRTALSIGYIDTDPSTKDSVRIFTLSREADEKFQILLPLSMSVGTPFTAQLKDSTGRLIEVLNCFVK